MIAKMAYNLRRMDYGGNEPFGPPENPNDPGRLHRQFTASQGLDVADMRPDTSAPGMVNSTMTGSPSYQVPPGSDKVPFDWAGAERKIGSVAQAITPFVSNIVNAFRKPPRPTMPKYNNYVSLSRPRFDADKAEVSREVNATNKSAYRNMDANSAAAVGQFNLGKKLNEYSRINEQQHNSDIAIGNQQSMVNANISAGNNQKTDEYNQLNLERNIAQGREQSANWANAGDKYTAMANEREKGRVELSKAQTLSGLYDQSGVMDRLRRTWKADGRPDPLGLDYKDKPDSYWSGRYGGRMHAPSMRINRFGKLKSLRPLKQYQS